MRIAEMDLPNLEFMKLMRARDFPAAHKSLENLVNDQCADDECHKYWKAVLFEREGNYPAAIELLNTLVVGEDPRARFNRHARARVLVRAGMLDDALADFQELLADQTPQVVDALHAGCKFQIAHILALQGDPACDDMLNSLPPDAEHFIKDEILTKGDLQGLYRANQKRSRQSVTSTKRRKQGS